MTIAELLSEESKDRPAKSVITSGGVASVDASGAAKLLQANGVLQSAKLHMQFHDVVVKKIAGKKLLIRVKRKK